MRIQSKVFVIFLMLSHANLFGRSFSSSKPGKPLPEKPLKNSKTIHLIPEKPKLVIGIVIDQMRVDFLYRYFNKYGKGGFKRLMREGYNNRNTQYPYVPTYTAPGHSCIFTGSIPAINGMVGNDWYSRNSRKTVYCTDDSSAHAVGGSEKSGKMSPKNLLSTTITDQLRLGNNFRSKVIGVSQKDRAAILPAGHTANAAYWLDSQTGDFMTSTYYMPELPLWVKAFNTKKLAAKYLSAPWNTLLPIEKYTESTPDDEPWENTLPGESKPTFPHDLQFIRTNDFELIRSTPFGNSITNDFAIESIKQERLGKSGFTDFLTLSFSSTDYVGHAFGPNSIETEDTYLRLDKNIEDLLSFLDSYLGKDNFLIFLTADHGVANVPAFNRANKLPGGVIDPELEENFRKIGRNFAHGQDLIEKFINDEIYLKKEVLETFKISRRQLLDSMRALVLKQDGISEIIDLENLYQSSLPDSKLQFFRNGYYSKRSGDFQLVTEPGWFFGHSTGTTHGTNNTYDTHVPLLWYGWKIKPGESTEKVSVTDIAPTLANMLGLLEPSGSIGKIILNP